MCDSKKLDGFFYNLIIQTLSVKLISVPYFVPKKLKLWPDMLDYYQILPKRCQCWKPIRQLHNAIIVFLFQAWPRDQFVWSTHYSSSSYLQVIYRYLHNVSGFQNYFEDNYWFFFLCPICKDGFQSLILSSLTRLFPFRVTCLLSLT